MSRLSRGELVAISRVDELPRDAVAARERARATGACSLLGVPVSLGERVICALVINAGWPRRWPQPLIDGVQLLAEILGTGVERCRQESTLRSNVAVIEQLNARLEADNRC